MNAWGGKYFGALTDSNDALPEPFVGYSLDSSNEELWTFCRNSWTSDSSECPRVGPIQVDRQSWKSQCPHSSRQWSCCISVLDRSKAVARNPTAVFHLEFYSKRHHLMTSHPLLLPCTNLNLLKVIILLLYSPASGVPAAPLVNFDPGEKDLAVTFVVPFPLAFAAVDADPLEFPLLELEWWCAWWWWWPPFTLWPPFEALCVGGGLIDWTGGDRSGLSPTLSYSESSDGGPPDPPEEDPDDKCWPFPCPFPWSCGLPAWPSNDGAGLSVTDVVPCCCWAAAYCCKSWMDQVVPLPFTPSWGMRMEDGVCGVNGESPDDMSNWSALWITSPEHGALVSRSAFVNRHNAFPVKVKEITKHHSSALFTFKNWMHEYSQKLHEPSIPTHDLHTIMLLILAWKDCCEMQ